MNTVTRRILAGVTGALIVAFPLAAAPASATVASTDFYSGIGASAALARQAALSDALADGYVPGDCHTISTENLGHGRWEVSISCTH